MSIASMRNLSFAAAVGFSLSAVHAAEPVHITAVHQGSAKPYKLMVDAFNKVHPDIVVEMLPIVSTYEEILQSAARGKVVGNPPDVIAVGYNLVRYATENTLISEIPADPAADWQSLGYPASSISLCSFGGNLMGLPLATSAPVLFYNADLVRKAGGDPDRFPKDWPGIFDLARKIDDLDAKTIGLQFRYDHSGNFSYQGLIFSQGGRMMSEDEKQIAFNGRAGMNGLDVLRHAVEAGMLDLTSDQARQAFAAGTIGIMAESSSALTGMARTAEGHFDLRVASYPLSPDGTLPAGGACASIGARDPAKKAAALEYVKFVTGPVGQTIQANNLGYIPTNTKALNDPQYLGGFYDSRPNERIVADLLPRLAGWYSFPGENAIRITEIIKDHLQSVVTAHKAPQEVMDAMTRDVGALLPKTN